MDAVQNAGATARGTGPDYTSPVQAKIESQIGKISDLQAEVARLMQEMRSLTPPENPGADASDEAKERYQQELQQFQAQLARLQGQIESTQKKLDEAIALLNRLQNSDMPDAQRREANALREQFEAEAKRMEEAAKQLEELAKASSGGTGSSGPTRAELARQNEVQRQMQQLATLGGPAAGSGIPINEPDI